MTTADGGHIASCSVTVTPIKVTGISLSQNELTLILGNIQMLGATVSPGNATDKSYTWASDNSAVASVDSSGRVTANAIGTATISATTTDGNKIAACAVTVAPIRVTGVTLSERAASVLVGDTLFLRATVSPADATDASFAWKSSDTSIASIDTSGFVRTYKIGAATITATTSDGEKTAECVVTVGPVRVSRITISDSVISLKPTETKTLRATIAPENASDKRHTWSSSNNEIATVSQEGVVTAHRAGTATITVTAADGGLQSSCTVTVDAIRVSSVGVSETAVTLFVGESETLAVTISPANAGNKAVTWSSNTSAVATVDRAGQVTAQGIGTAILTLRASDGGVESYVTVRVLPRYVEAIVLRPDKLAMKIGETSRLSAEVSPFNATDSTYTWHSNNPSVATVDENGSVTGVSLGEATISAVANDGSGIKGECRVVVEDKASTAQWNINDFVAGVNDFWEGTKSLAGTLANWGNDFAYWAFSASIPVAKFVGPAAGIMAFFAKVAESGLSGLSGLVSLFSQEEGDGWDEAAKAIGVLSTLSGWISGGLTFAEGVADWWLDSAEFFYYFTYLGLNFWSGVFDYELDYKPLSFYAEGVHMGIFDGEPEEITPSESSPVAQNSADILDGLRGWGITKLWSGRLKQLFLFAPTANSQVHRETLTTVPVRRLWDLNNRPPTLLPPNDQPAKDWTKPNTVAGQCISFPNGGNTYRGPSIVVTGASVGQTTLTATMIGGSAGAARASQTIPVVVITRLPESYKASPTADNTVFYPRPNNNRRDSTDNERIKLNKTDKVTVLGESADGKFYYVKTDRKNPHMWMFVEKGKVVEVAQSGWISSNLAKVRSGPGSNYSLMHPEKIGPGPGHYKENDNGLGRNSPVCIIGESGNWWKISYYGKDAYVLKSDVTLTRPTMPSYGSWDKYISPVNWPVLHRANTSSGFNANRGGGVRGHGGVDFRPEDSYIKDVPVNQRPIVYAVADGEVLGYTPGFWWGTDYLIVKNDDGKIVGYGEIKATINTTPGTRVKQGQPIARLHPFDETADKGCTGYSMLHLDFYMGTVEREDDIITYWKDFNDSGNKTYDYVTTNRTLNRKRDLLDPTFFTWLPIKEGDYQ